MKRFCLLTILVSGCGIRLVDPCAGVTGTCLAVQVERAASAPAIDTLVVEVTGVGFHATSTPASTGGPLSFPVAIGVVFDALPESPLGVTATVTGSHSGTAVAHGAALALLVDGQHTTVQVPLDGGIASDDLGAVSDGLGAAGHDLAASHDGPSAPVITIDRAPAHDYGVVDVGAAAHATFKVTSHAAQPLPAPALTLDNHTDFVVESSSCGVGALAALGSCDFSIVFVPASHGVKRCTVIASASGSSATVDLTGIGQDYVTLKVVRSGDSSNTGSVTADGTITIDPAMVECGATCSLRLARGATDPVVTLSATPDAVTSQPTVASWTGCDSASGNSCTATVTGTSAAPTTVTADFALKEYAWTFVNRGLGAAAGALTFTSGSCASGATCPVTYRHGDAISVSAQPAGGSNAVTSDHVSLPWGFSWSSGPCAGTSTSPCAVASVTSAATVTALFAPYNYMFVTSLKVAPGLLGASDPMGAGDGFRGGDAICQQLANASPKTAGATYRAFLASYSLGVDALARLFNATTKQAPRGWVRTDGRPFSDTIATGNASSQTMSFPLLDETGAIIGAPFDVATGARGTGAPESNTVDCNGWSSPMGHYTSGDAGDGNHFFAERQSTLTCGTTGARLYCFGIDFVAPLSLPLPTVPFKRSFASQSQWQPGGSITAADSACQKDALAAGWCKPGEACPFLAVLTPLGDRASSRFTNVALPIYRPDYVRVAASTTDFFAGTIDAGLERRLDGNFTGGYFHWTGGLGTGTVASTCNGWLDGSATAMGGVTQLPEVQMHPPATSSTTFFGTATRPCTANEFLMCLEN
jgi:hypothetical protein